MLYKTLLGWVCSENTPSPIVLTISVTDYYDGKNFPKPCQNQKMSSNLEERQAIGEILQEIDVNPGLVRDRAL
jgi:hypothetical protein